MFMMQKYKTEFRLIPGWILIFIEDGYISIQLIFSNDFHSIFFTVARPNSSTSSYWELGAAASCLFVPSSGASVAVAIKW